MSTRFTSIINSLNALGRINSLNALGRKYTNLDLVRKILRSLAILWEIKVTAIQEAKDRSKLPLDDLLGSLMTNEITMSEHDEEYKKRKSIALKSSVIKDENEEEDEESNNEDVALITRNFKKKKIHLRKIKTLNPCFRCSRKFKKSFLRKKQERRDFKDFKKDSYKGDKKKEPIICYECKKFGI